MKYKITKKVKAKLLGYYRDEYFTRHVLLAADPQGIIRHTILLHRTHGCPWNPGHNTDELTAAYFQVCAKKKLIPAGFYIIRPAIDKSSSAAVMHNVLYFRTLRKHVKSPISFMCDDKIFVVNVNGRIISHYTPRSV